MTVETNRSELDTLFEQIMSDPNLPEQDKPILQGVHQHCASLIARGTDPSKVLEMLLEALWKEMRHREALNN